MNTRLRALRIENGITQKQLACELHTSDKNIWAYEKGIATPPYDVLSSYADYFGVTTDYLIGRTNDFEISTTAPSVNTYTAEERQVIQDYRKLTRGMREILRTTLNAMVNDSKKDTID